MNHRATRKRRRLREASRRARGGGRRDRDDFGAWRGLSGGSEGSRRDGTEERGDDLGDRTRERFDRVEERMDRIEVRQQRVYLANGSHATRERDRLAGARSVSRFSDLPGTALTEVRPPHRACFRWSRVGPPTISRRGMPGGRVPNRMKPLRDVVSSSAASGLLGALLYHILAVSP
jgi:hypothetical protein